MTEPLRARSVQLWKLGADGQPVGEPQVIDGSFSLDYGFEPVRAELLSLSAVSFDVTVSADVMVDLLLLLGFSGDEVEEFIMSAVAHQSAVAAWEDDGGALGKDTQ